MGHGTPEPHVTAATFEHASGLLRPLDGRWLQEAGQLLLSCMHWESQCVAPLPLPFCIYTLPAITLIPAAGV